MPRAWFLLAAAALFGPAVGCHHFCQHTAGVCDCNPPPVASVLHQSPTPAPLAPAGEPVHPMPHAP